MITEKSTVVNDLETRYLIGGEGRGSTVVFLHDGAWGASSDVTWGGVLPLAAQTHRVIAPDLLGFGGSAKAVRLDQSPFGFRLRHVYSLLDQIDASGPIHLVGNSFGGSIALRALLDERLSGRLASVTSISGTGGPWRSATSAELGSYDGTREDMTRIVRLLCDDYPGIEEQIDARMRWAAMPGHYAGMLAPHAKPPEPLRTARPADPYPEPFAEVTTPVLVFDCAGDPLVERGWVKHLTDRCQTVTVAPVPHKHAPNISHPEQTWSFIADFVRGA
ncbi:alpha/beta hydrolase [Saccharopolyspora sp. WRP15-2]|uniref:Alpha/beta hydrolase n=1 Tax=Saccharopolyspora oryzae TaxID=2997343 RepID=A0ABT4UWV4_9PSEU|nr:alpha/beta hydrolase [Saccharopolyspora oryzae]MDA3626165.1 alpha/beta hydrolase [Saccharopolyspora oryzae]